MEEDVLGPREEVLGDRYTRCSNCGEVIPVDKAKLISVGSDPHAMQLEELCEECRREIDTGEAVLPPGGVVDDEMSG